MFHSLAEIHSDSEQHRFLGFFLMWIIFKVFIEFATILSRFMFWFSGFEACGILAPQPEIEPAPPALEGKASTMAPPGKSLSSTQVAHQSPT